MTNAIKALFVMLLMATSLSAYAQSTTNSIYIDQVGGSSTINLTQKGQNNKVGTEQNRFQIGGDSQTINMTQTGNGNSTNGQVVDADNINYGVTVTGDSNTLTMNHGDSGSVAGSTLTLGVTGNSNDVTLTQGSTSSSTGADQIVDITGDQNTYTSTINADDVKNRMTITGDSNTHTMTQNGFAGKEVTSTVTGNNNNITVNQTSTLNVDKIDITHTGSGNTITINQCNAGGSC